MKINPKQSGGTIGFTLVELLTVLAIIALLIGLLVPALNTTRRYAQDVRQRAQFHSVEAALETFHGDYGDYPPSRISDDSSSGLWTCGAQKLCEALVGLDLRGFDPVSNFDISDTLANTDAYAITSPQDEESLARRKGPYLKIDENVGIYNLEALFGVGNTGVLYPGSDPTNREFGPVICDTYKVKNIQIPDPTDSNDPPSTITAKAGTPVLYYRANASSKIFPKAGEASDLPAVTETYIYDIFDNAELVDLGVFTKLAAERDNTHLFDMDVSLEAFYTKISNRKISTQRWPHNPDSYILISAGYDGIYGTDDDITNFSGEFK